MTDETGWYELAGRLTRERDECRAEIVALNAKLDARQTQLCEARKALHDLSYPDVRAQDLRAIASEVDCDDCPHMGLFECSKETRGEFCGGAAANGLRKLADALDVKAKADAERAAELAKQDIAF